MPTDIVNHRLKIAIEIQGQFHEREPQKVRDKIKKEYWIDKEYAFYDYKIEGVPILEYVQYFSPNIKIIPEYVSFDYSSKLNLKEIQKKLDTGMSTREISIELGIEEHRIYDAIHSNKVSRADDYQYKFWTPVVQLSYDGNFIREYRCISDAEKDNNITKGLISSSIGYKRYFSSGYYWFYKEDYESGYYKQHLNSRNAKMYKPVSQYSLDGAYIKSYSTILAASKEAHVNGYKIWEVANGIRKSIKGYKYKYTV